MELTYQHPMMPASYSAISCEEMTYIGGGFDINEAAVNALNFGINFVVNFTNMMGRAAFTTAIAGLIAMHEDGMTMGQSIAYFWDGQTTAGKVGTVVVGGFAGLYVYQQVMSIYATIKNLYTDLKNAYEMSKAQQNTAAAQDIGLADPIVAAAA